MRNERWLISLTFLVPLSLWITGSLLGCGPEARGIREQPIPASFATAAELAWPIRLPGARALPPSESEVRNTVQRVFGADLQIDGHPQFLAGDFNGDESEDLAVVVRPSKEKVSELNNPLANWTVQDPVHAYVRAKNKSVVVPPPVPAVQPIGANETLLAVVHGYGTGGWRDPMARQAYLLHGAAGTSLHVGEPSPALLKSVGMFPSRRDVINEQLGELHGALYWTGASYAWHTEK